MELSGFIIAELQDKEILDNLGITYTEPYKYGSSGEYMFENCKVPMQSMQELDQHFGRMIWHLEAK